MTNSISKFRFAKWTHNIFNSAKNMGCLYNSLTMDTIYYPGNFYEKVETALAENNVNALRKISDINGRELLEEAKSKKIVVNFDYNEFDVLERISRKFLTRPSINTMILLVTDHCNLNCKYCYIERSLPSNYQKSHMTKEVAKAAIEKFVSIADANSNSLKITFYGGEPLLNWEVVEFALKYIDKIEDKISKEIHKILITNGMLLDETKIKILSKYNVHVALSLDGPREFHDRYRVFPDGRGTFDLVIKALNLLREHNLEPSISTVLTKEAILHIEKILKFFLDDLNIRKIGFNHISIIPSINSYDPEYEKEFGKAIIKIHEFILRRGDVYERRASKKIYNFFKGEIQKADCTGCGEQIAVSPDGKIGVCQGFIGSRLTFNRSVFDKNYNPINDPIFIEWSRRSPLNMKQCYDCIALAICGGGCPRNAYMLLGSIWDKDIAYCHFAKMFCEWLIWKKYETLSESTDIK